LVSPIFGKEGPWNIKPFLLGKKVCLKGLKGNPLFLRNFWGFLIFYCAKTKGFIGIGINLTPLLGLGKKFSLWKWGGKKL